jgi:hypothetical protein
LNRRNPLSKSVSAFLITALLFTGCATTPIPYTGNNPENPQFERGISVPPLDFFGDLLSKPYQLLLWTRKYGNHRISRETEQAMAEFLKYYEIKDVKVRINQWAPHKEIGRLVVNKHIAWPYKILFFPSTLIVSLLARPFSGFLFSDYYDPGSHSIHIFSDEIAIALHESGHAKDFYDQRWKGTYALARMLPGVNLVQESLATDEAIYYLEKQERYEDLFRSYKVLYPAYATYIAAYLSSSPVVIVGAITIGHIIGREKARDKRRSLIDQRKYKLNPV